LNIRSISKRSGASLLGVAVFFLFPLSLGAVCLVVLNQDRPQDLEKSLQRGDIVTIHPDAKCAENPSASSPFVLLIVPDGLRSHFKQYVEVTTGTVTRNSREVPGQITKARRYRINLDNLPLSVKTDLAVNGRTTVNRSQVGAVIKDTSR